MRASAGRISGLAMNSRHSSAPSRERHGVLHVLDRCLAGHEAALNGDDERHQPEPRRAQDPDLYAGEPYVMPGNIAGPLAAVPGQAGWTWCTGSAAWYLRALVEGVPGVDADTQGLRVRASLPDDWDRFRIKRQYRGTTYDITVRRAASGDQPGCFVDGAPWAGDVLLLAEQPGIAQTVTVIV